MLRNKGEDTVSEVSVCDGSRRKGQLSKSQLVAPSILTIICHVLYIEYKGLWRGKLATYTMVQQMAILHVGEGLIAF